MHEPAELPEARNPRELWPGSPSLRECDPDATPGRMRTRAELRSKGEQPRDAELKPTTLGGDWLAVHLGSRAARCGGMIEDASHLDNVTDRKRVGMVTGRV